jgi:hypothetical protein
MAAMKATTDFLEAADKNEKGTRLEVLTKEEDQERREDFNQLQKQKEEATVGLKHKESSRRQVDPLANDLK